MGFMPIGSVIKKSDIKANYLCRLKECSIKLKWHKILTFRIKRGKVMYAEWERSFVFIPIVCVLSSHSFWTSDLKTYYH